MSVHDIPFFPTATNGKAENGKDGISPTITITDIDNGHRLTITDITGTKTIDVLNGANGENGKQGTSGKDGESALIKSASATIDNTSGTPNVNVTLGGTDTERTFAFAFTGLKGAKGDTGSQGIQGIQGIPGIQGEKGEPGAAGNDGIGVKSLAINDSGELIITYTNNTEINLGKVIGDKGETGTNGLNGKSAYDYAKAGGYSKTETEFTETLANAVNKQNISLGLHTDGLIYLFINGEPTGTGIEQSTSTNAQIVGFIDTNNDIILTGELDAGTYTFKYENEDGSYTDIGFIEIDEGNKIINLVITSLNINGSGIYNNIGYKDGTYISMDSITDPPSKDGSDSTIVATGLIPYNWEPLYVKGVTIDPNTSHCRAQYISSDYFVKYQLASGSWAWTNFMSIENLGTSYYKLTPLYTSQKPGTLEDLDTVAYIRFSFIGIGANLIISTSEIA